MKPPPKTIFTNWKLQPLIISMDSIFTLIWMLGYSFSTYVMTLHFKGRHADKIRMTYKEEYGELQTDAFFKKRYIYQIFMCNDPFPKTYLSKIMFPLSDILIALFDTVEEKHNQCAMGNIYNSAEFSRQRTIMRKITDSWCYNTRSGRHPSIH